MRRFFCTAAILALSASTLPAVAADASPIGDWLVKDGFGIIRVDNCNGKMWGIVAWEKSAGIDKENPDPTKKGRPTLGVPILLGMAPTKPNKWEGEIYNTENGKVYSGSITVAGESKLQLEGCLFPNFLCGGQDWTRVTALPTEGVSLPKGAQAKGAPPAKKGPAAASDVCTRVAEEASTPRGTAKK
jgi:uncharacterized protein (DUF2147 family)